MEGSAVLDEATGETVYSWSTGHEYEGSLLHSSRFEFEINIWKVKLNDPIGICRIFCEINGIEFGFLPCFLRCSRWFLIISAGTYDTLLYRDKAGVAVRKHAAAADGTPMFMYAVPLPLCRISLLRAVSRWAAHHGIHSEYDSDPKPPPELLTVENLNYLKVSVWDLVWVSFIFWDAEIMNVTQWDPHNQIFI